MTRISDHLPVLFIPAEGRISVSSAGVLKVGLWTRKWHGNDTKPSPVFCKRLATGGFAGRTEEMYVDDDILGARSVGGSRRDGCLSWKWVSLFRQRSEILIASVLTVEASRTSWKRFIVCCNLVIPDPAFGRPGPAGQSSLISVQSNTPSLFCTAVRSAQCCW